VYQGEELVESISRRNMLAATAAEGLLTVTRVAAAQTVEGIPQPRRPLERQRRQSLMTKTQQQADSTGKR
jgi:hypothetical protein